MTISGDFDQAEGKLEGAAYCVFSVPLGTRKGSVREFVGESAF